MFLSNCLKGMVGLLAAYACWLGCVGAPFADDAPKVKGFTPGEELVFETRAPGDAADFYLIESANSLEDPVWSAVATASGMAGSQEATATLDEAGDGAFYRVRSTVNSAEFRDGAYMVIDVSGGVNSGEYPVTHYASLTELPFGPNSETYKTDNILMRYIPRGEFPVGSPASETGRRDDEAQRRVKLSQGFYIGVYPITQRQWERVVGTWPSYFNNPECRATRPVEKVSYDSVRGASLGAGWPASTAVDEASFLGSLRARAGLGGLDLPTEAQWEYACRAGTAAALNSGEPLTASETCPNMARVGRYQFNGGGWESPQDCGPSAGTAIVGSYPPNAWGLFDMHGNVFEWCLDWYGTYKGDTTDPVGNSPADNRVCRGGSHMCIASYGRSAARMFFPSALSMNDTGFRIALNIE